MDPQEANEMSWSVYSLLLDRLVEEAFLQGSGAEFQPPMRTSAAPITLLRGPASNLTAKTMCSDDLSARQRREKSARWKWARLLKTKTKVKVLGWNGESGVPGMLTPAWQWHGSEWSGGEWKGRNVCVNLKEQRSLIALTGSTACWKPRGAGPPALLMQTISYRA